MQGWKVRLSVALAMLAMVLAISVPSMAQDFGDECLVEDEDGNVVEIDCDDVFFFEDDCFVEGEDGSIIEVDCDDIFIAVSLEEAEEFCDEFDLDCDGVND